MSSFDQNHLRKRLQKLITLSSELARLARLQMAVCASNDVTTLTRLNEQESLYTIYAELLKYLLRETDGAAASRAEADEVMNTLERQVELARDFVDHLPGIQPRNGSG